MESNPSNGRTSKSRSYLLYAIGEIMLVVIGILIALQVNNWNQNRKQEIAEQGYLNSLQEDFNKDIQAQDSIIPILKRKSRSTGTKKQIQTLAGANSFLLRSQVLALSQATL